MYIEDTLQRLRRVAEKDIFLHFPLLIAVFGAALVSVRSQKISPRYLYAIFSGVANS